MKNPVIEILKQIIIYDITLHKKLGALVQREKILLNDDRLDDVSAEVKERKQIEAEIENVNKTIASYFVQIEAGDISINESQKIALSPFLNKLRDSIKTTMNIIDQTGNELQKIRNETLAELKMFGNGKKAIKSYSYNNNI